MAHPRSVFLRSLATPAIALGVVAGTIGLTIVTGACGGAIDNGELFQEGSSSGASGTTPTPTSTPPSKPTATPTPAPTSSPPKPNDKPCVVSFEKDVLQLFEDYDCTSSSCHGGNLNAPRITASNPTGTYQALKSFKLSTGKAYVAVGATDPKSSAMYCNLRGQCGVPMPIGDKLDEEELQVIDDWLACGAPLN
jgi:hypothetical protein